MRGIYLLLLIIACCGVAKGQAPSVTIAADKTIICPGVANNFTATPTNASAAVDYQWQVNGVNAGSNSKTFSSAALNNGDRVSCMISNTGNVAFPTATSNNITLTAGTLESPGVVVAETIANLCSVTFEAAPINAGTAPLYKWTVNGVDMGVNSSTFVDDHPTDNDKIACTLVNTTTCAPNNSATDGIKLTASKNGITLTITAVEGNEVCDNEEVNFSLEATPAIPGTWYYWYVNGAVEVGQLHTALSIGIPRPKDGDEIQCKILNPDPCLAGSGPVESNIIKLMVVHPPTVTITADKNDVCTGTPITITAVVKPLQNPTYTWKINGEVAPNEHLDKFTSSSFKEGDQVTCTVVNTSRCNAPVTSSTLLMHINPLPVITMPDIININLGKSVQLKPVITGSISSYQWIPASGLSSTTIADPMASPSIATKYQLVVTSASGCQSTAFVTVKVNIVITPPNTFTPNGDGINDTWLIPDLAPYTDCVVDIFDRQGQVIYHSVGYSKAWDGTRNGKPLPVGTYYYVIDTKRAPNKFAGPVTIIR